MIIFRKASPYIGILGLVLLGFLVLELNEPKPQPVYHDQPATNPYIHAIAASGIVESIDRNIEIGVAQTGLITKLFVSVGDKVDPGQPLFQLDDRELSSQLSIQEAQVAVAKASLSKLESHLRCLESVDDQRAVSLEEIKNCRHDVMIAQAECNLAIAHAQQTNQQMERLVTRAPKKGTILKNGIMAGEIATPDEIVLVLGDTQRLQIRADIDEQNAINFSPNAVAQAFPKNNHKYTIPLKFERIEPYVIPKNSLTNGVDERVDTRVLQIIYSFDNPVDFNVYVGQQVDLFIENPNSKDNNDRSS